MRIRAVSTAAVLILSLGACGDALAGSGKRAVPRSEGSPKAAPRTPSRGAPSPAKATASRTSRDAPVRASGRASYGHGVTILPRGPWFYDPWGYPGYGGPWGYGSWWGWGPYGVWPYYGSVGIGTAWAGEPWADEDASIPGTVETDVLPRNATVRVDGEELGFAKDFNGTWDALRLAPGVRVLEFSKDGYRTFRAVVDVRAGRTYRIERRLEKGEGLDPGSDPLQEAGSAPVGPPARGFLRFRVEPGDAAVYLDGVFLGSASELGRLRGALPVAAGSHRIEIVRPGFETWTAGVEVSPGGDAARVEVRLTRSP